MRKADQPAADDARVVVALPAAAGTGVANASPRNVELLAQAAATRRQSRILAARLRAAQCRTGETARLLRATWDRTETIRELWLAARAERLQYSAYARLQARLASMPVIEQAKGIIMAQCGCPEDQAFDALRRASQRENIKLRDLAARIVANTVREPAAQKGGPRKPAGPPGSASLPRSTRVASSSAE
jgi:hypothetical protein